VILSDPLALILSVVVMIIRLTLFSIQTSENLVPDYITGRPTFSDAASSAALASVAYRVAQLYPQQFGANYTQAAGRIRDTVLCNVTNLGTMQPIVDPLSWSQIGLLSTESQAFGLMMVSAWRDWIGL
jgi:hypothetical protein